MAKRSFAWLSPINLKIGDGGTVSVEAAVRLDASESGDNPVVSRNGQHHFCQEFTMLSSRMTRWAGHLKHTLLRNGALLQTDVCELCGEPCMPQASTVSVCVPACKAVPTGAVERANAQAAFEVADSRSLELVA